MGASLGAFTEWMDKIFGGPDEKRTLIQAIALLVFGIILDIIPGALTAAAAAVAISNPTLSVQLSLAALGAVWCYYVGGLLITLGVIGLIWFVLRKTELIES